jgi:hypothetical protein
MHLRPIPSAALSIVGMAFMKLHVVVHTGKSSNLVLKLGVMRHLGDVREHSKNIVGL